jgi:hypothetical protein
MSTAQNNITKIEDALSKIPTSFKERLLKTYIGLKNAYSEGSFDACGLRVGKFCEVFLRWLQYELTGKYVAFGSKIDNFTDECEKLAKAPKNSGHESVRILIPRALNFLYTLRNKRGIGHEGGDVDANRIDSSVAVSAADWCMSELIRLKYSASLEEAQAICDAVIARKLPQIWEVSGKKRVLNQKLNYVQQTLLLLYSTPDTAVPAEDLLAWTEHSNSAIYKRDILRRLHAARLIEYDEEIQMVSISPQGIVKVESEIL